MIRQATSSDIPDLMRLLDQVNAVHHRGRPDIFKRATKYSTEELASILLNPSEPVFIFEDENKQLLGHAFCCVQEIDKNNRLLQQRKTLYIDDICVDEQARRRGIGKELYAHCEAFAKSIGCDAVTLNVWCLNPDAEAFYKQMGLLPQKITMERVLKP